jgi:hypothetical protein
VLVPVIVNEHKVRVAYIVHACFTRMGCLVLWAKAAPPTMTRMAMTP